MSRLLALLLFLMLSCPADILAGRPFITEDAGTMPAGKAELEIGHEYRDGPGQPASLMGNYTLNLGLPARSEIDLGVPVTYHLDGDGPSEAGFGDLGLLLKTRFLDEGPGWRPALAVAGSVSFPSGDADRGLGAGKAGYAVLGVASKQLGKLHVDTDAGWRFPAEGRDGLFSGVAITYELLERWFAAAEYAGFTDFADETRNENASFLLGLIWTPAKSVALDAAVRTDTADADFAYDLILGLTWDF